MDISLLIFEYLDNLKNIKRYSGNTIKAYREDLVSFTNFCRIHNREEISKISEKFIKSFLAELNEHNLDKISISRKLSSLRGLFKFAYLNGFTNFNPLTNISNPKYIRKLPGVVPTEIILKVYTIAEESEDDHALVKIIFELLYGCALRVSELCRLKLEDLDIDRKTLHIWGKGNKIRYVPVGDKSLQIIHEYLLTRDLKNKDPLLITEKGIQIYPRLVHRLINKYLSKVSDLKKKSPHILRHSAATHMLDNGADLRAVKEILGHENLSTTQIYTHVSIERLKKTYKKAHPKS
jgi:site-specific recombinase XerD